MPREPSSKRPSGSKPYPKTPAFSAAQAEKIAKALMVVLNAGDDDDNDEQTTFSEDEEGSQGEQEQATTPATLSTSSSDISLLQAALAPLEATLQDSLDKLHKLPGYLAKFVANNNAEGIQKTTTLLVRHEAIVTETEAKIATLKDAWAAEERAKQQAAKEAQQRALEKKEAAKSKGKATAAHTEEDDQFAELAELAMEMEIPEGDLSYLPKPKQVCSDLESLDVLLASDAHPVNVSRPPPGAPHTPTSFKHRFPDKRILPQAFSLSKSRTVPRLSPGPQSPRAVPIAGSSFTPTSTAFGEIPLQAPDDFSPSKVKESIVVLGDKKGKKGAKPAKPQTAGGAMRMGLRQIARRSYKDKGEDDDEDEAAIDSAVDQED